MAQAVERRSRIVVIDDHDEFRSLMSDVLSARYDVVTFSGRELPVDILESRPDLVMVDLCLDTGDLEGWGVVTMIRSNRHLRRIPIILCSADVDGLNGHADAVESTGNTAMLPKPFTLEQVEELVRDGLADSFPSAPLHPSMQ
jgi:CheY-like chemotaxis protein